MYFQKRTNRDAVLVLTVRAALIVVIITIGGTI